ncbi:hypothetical protein FOL47_000166 [Perkinsus chesapeaki]|uniref:Integrase catalytic domain-containing protein n=1 Tax=Perkinsus chesapeaki TaxID=330153 RepID=A0A7J6KX60_PERCH|nr:hypothetical protein FOL47_000166 [Perkinsus chesapeaki]
MTTSTKKARITVFKRTSRSNSLPPTGKAPTPSSSPSRSQSAEPRPSADSNILPNILPIVPPDLQQELSCYEKDDKGRFIVTDPTHQSQLLSLTHQYHHEGQEPTKFRVDQIATWPTIQDDNKTILDKCEVCARTQIKKGDHWFKMKPVPRPLPEWPFMKVQLDDLGPRYNKYHCLLLIDVLYGYVISLPLSHTPTYDDVIHLLKETHLIYGIFPSLVKSDKASYFVKANSELSSLPYAPIWEWSSASQSVGMIERTIKEFNKKIRRYLGHLSIITLDQWISTIRFTTSEINSYPQLQAQGLSPRDLIFRHPAQHPITYQPTKLRISYDNIDAIWRSHRNKSRQATCNRVSVRNDNLSVGDYVYVLKDPFCQASLSLQ